MATRTPSKTLISSIYLGLGLLLVGCNRLDNSTVAPAHFYEYSHVSDLSRLPLLQPYELISADGITWCIQPDREGKNTCGFDSVYVEDSIVVVHAKSIYVQGAGMTEAWFIFHGDHTNERTVTSRKDLENALTQNGRKSVAFYDVPSTFKTFEQTGKLPWR